MSFGQIDLRIQYKHKHTFPFNSESWCVSELYWSFLNNYETGKVRKVNIQVSDNWVERINHYDDWQDSKGVYLYFDIEKYLTLSNQEKKSMQLEIIYQGMKEIAKREGWPIEPLEEAYNKCLETNLEYKFYKGKPKSSPNRKYKIGFWCNWDIDIFELYYVLYDKKGNELKKVKFVEKEPFRGELAYYLKWKWLDNNIVKAENTYIYGQKDIWEINLNLE